jgi:RNA polymerase sigma-70 factor (ECF subfamily)
VDERAWLTERFEEHRTRLRAVAYRMLGSRSDAVQEAWLRLSRADTGSDRQRPDRPRRLTASPAHPVTTGRRRRRTGGRDPAYSVPPWSTHLDPQSDLAGRTG